jgi:hypothetical protein
MFLYSAMDGIKALYIEIVEREEIASYILNPLLKYTSATPVHCDDTYIIEYLNISIYNLLMCKNITTSLQ